MRQRAIIGAVVFATLMIVLPAGAAPDPKVQDVFVTNDADNPVVVGAVKIDPVQNTVQIGGQPIQVESTPGSEQRFSVFQQASSAQGTSANCTDLTTLPAGTLLIESIDIYAFRAMVTYMSVSTESAAGGSFGGTAQIPLLSAELPNSSDAAAHTSTAVVVHDNGLADAGPGQLTRDETHPVQLCVQDDQATLVVNSRWTISGRVLD